MKKRNEIEGAVGALAAAVHRVASLDGREGRALYLRSEFLREMERILLEQLLTVIDSSIEREWILEENELDYLETELAEMTEEWE